jgi:hypothetical protein
VPTTLPAPGPVLAPAWRDETCATCPLPFLDWDSTHPLFRPWSKDCPDCLHAALDEDARLARLEDR